MSQLDSKLSFLLWLLFVGGGLALALVIGRLDPHYVPDSRSYLEYPFGSLEKICRASRLPAYPLWLLLFRQTVGIAVVPAAQVIVHATASWLLFRELGKWGMAVAPRLAAAIAVGIGCTAMDHIHTISTDAMAASLGVITATAVLRWARLDGGELSWLPIVIAAVTTIFLRPAYLFLIPWILVAGAMLRRSQDTDWRSAWRSSFGVSLLTALPILAWMTMRLIVVGDFGILPFGHQNLAGILIQLVNDEELTEVGGEHGAAIVEAKNEFDEEVGFAAGEAGATMTIDARWDDMTWRIVVPSANRLVGGDIVASHQAMARLNRAIIRRFPLRYVTWLLKAARRGAWGIAADMVMHPVFLAVIGVMVLLLLRQVVIGRAATVTIGDTVGFRAFTIVTFTYLIAKLGFVILTSPPIGRFSDAAAIFLPAWLAAVCSCWLGSKDAGRQNPDTAANRMT